jgi:DNA polymerase-3 subunit delta'
VPLNDLRGQDRAVALLKNVLSGGKLPHAFLFSAPIDLTAAATAVAQAINCPVDRLGCGRCTRCQLIAGRGHPDLLTIARDPESAGREIRVEPVRQLRAALQLAPSEAPYKVAIIEEAGQLNPSAQNALLKILEEPPPMTVLILLADAEERLLPTVRSRCMRISFAWHPEEASSGWRGREQLVDDLTKLLAGRGTPAASLLALGFADHFSDDREEALQAAGTAAVFLRDLLRLMSAGPGGAPLTHADKLAQLNALASRLDPVEILDGLQALEDAVVALQGNGSARLQLEAAALKLGRAA